MIAAVEAARAGLWKREHWSRNAIAGVVVGVVALPLAIWMPDTLTPTLQTEPESRAQRAAR